MCTLLGREGLGEAPGVAGTRQRAGCCCGLEQDERVLGGAEDDGDGGGLREAMFTSPSVLSPPSEHRAS